MSRGDRIEVENLADRTLELFQRTLRIVDEQSDDVDTAFPPPQNPNRFVPEHRDLRQRFLFAETLGSYSALHDLLDGYSPAYRLSMDFDERSRIARLNEHEVRALEEYPEQTNSALLHVKKYLLANATCGYTSEELHELNEILLEARSRFESVTAILGMHLIYEVEARVLPRSITAFKSRVYATIANF